MSFCSVHVLAHVNALLLSKLLRISINDQNGAALRSYPRVNPTSGNSGKAIVVFLQGGGSSPFAAVEPFLLFRTDPSQIIEVFSPAQCITNASLKSQFFDQIEIKIGYEGRFYAWSCLRSGCIMRERKIRRGENG